MNDKSNNNEAGRAVWRLKEGSGLLDGRFEVLAILHAEGKDVIWQVPGHRIPWGCITEAVIICLVTAVLAGTSAFFLLRTVRMRVQWVWDVILYGQPRPTPEWPSRPIRPPYMPTEDFTDGIDTDRIID